LKQAIEIKNVFNLRLLTNNSPSLTNRQGLHGKRVLQSNEFTGKSSVLKTPGEAGINKSTGANERHIGHHGHMIIEECPGIDHVNVY
jgi:hypothetical protein